jgi:4'-phosphopantetheinyl transferase
MLIPEASSSEPRVPIRLRNSEVHLWKMLLEVNNKVASRLNELLSADEQEKASRFHFAADRRRFVITRGCLRALLSRYTNMAPETIQFAYGKYGKPSLPQATRESAQIEFNVAHSGNTAAFAFTRIGNIGIDIEQIRTDFDADDIAQRYFSAAEISSLGQTSLAARHAAFFSCWTRKEAFLKAKGVGLSYSLKQFDVTVSPTSPARLLSTRPDAKEAARWSMKSFDLARGYAATVVVAGHNWQLPQRQVSESLLPC